MEEKETIKRIFDMIQEELSDDIVRNEEYKKLNSKFSEIENDLRTIIGFENYKKVEELLNIYLLMSNLESEMSFTKGFSMANKLRDESLIKN